MLLIIALLFSLGIGLSLYNMKHLSLSLIESQALQNAQVSAQSLKSAIAIYSDEVVSRAKKVPGITVIHNYPTKDGAIPLPSTLLIDLGQKISKENTDLMARVYSDYPFPWRKNTGGPKDNFEQEALIALREDPTQAFVRQENFKGRTTWRYAEPIIMQPSCVACHNTHLNSPKRDWNDGDVRGILEIVQPVDKLISQVQGNLRQTFVMLGGISILGMSGLIVAFNKLRRTAKDLEIRVRERTADLANVNEDLEQSNRIIRQVFGRYLTDEVVATLLENPEGLKLGGDRRRVTILTSDLRGFTSFSEQLSPEVVIKVLNCYLESMAHVINKYQGTINEFMGDGILVLFGAPTLRENDAIRAVACAVEMQLAMTTVNQKMDEWGLSPLQMGIGINTGIVVVGNIGSEDRAKYGIVGSEVNLTYRIESYTIGGQILISEATLKAAGSIVRIEEKKQVQPKGVKQPINIYKIGGIGGAYNLFLPQEEEIFHSITKKVLLQYTILDGKHMNGAVFTGRLLKISTNNAEIALEDLVQDNVPVPLSNIKLNFININNSGEISADIYAKVLSQSIDDGSFYVSFTAIPSSEKDWLSALYESLATIRSNELL